MAEAVNLQKDSLTGCFTRDSLLRFLETVHIEASVGRKPYSLVLIDLDHFKEMNDKHGHAFGDEMLKYFSSTLRLSLETDEVNNLAQEFVFRYGGDEFVIVFPYKKPEQAYKIAGNVLYNIKHRPCLYHGRRYKISFSGGMASFPGDGQTPEELIEHADKSMYYSKKTGKGKITRYSRIKFSGSKNFMLFALVFVVVALILLVFLKYKDKIHFLWKQAKAKKADVLKQLNRQVKKIDDKNLSTVYLKKGGILKGTIIQEGEPLIIIVEFDQGKVTLSLEQSEIARIEKGKLTK